MTPCLCSPFLTSASCETPSAPPLCASWKTAAMYFMQDYCYAHHARLPLCTSYKTAAMYFMQDYRYAHHARLLRRFHAGPHTHHCRPSAAGRMYVRHRRGTSHQTSTHASPSNSTGSPAIALPRSARCRRCCCCFRRFPLFCGGGLYLALLRNPAAVCGHGCCSFAPAAEHQLLSAERLALQVLHQQTTHAQPPNNQLLPSVPCSHKPSLHGITCSPWTSRRAGVHACRHAYRKWHRCDAYLSTRVH
jgi:hypothetical protein